MEEHQRAILAAQGYCELKMYEDALAELDALPLDVHHHPVAVEMRLVTLMQAHRWGEALQVGLELCRLRPDASSGFIHAAFCYHELGQTEEARTTLLSGPPSIRNEANFHYNLACYECVLGNFEAARQHLEKSFTMDRQYREFAKTDPDLQGLGLRPVNLERLREEFERNFAEREELGASISIWHEGVELLTLAGGFQDREKTLPWLRDTPVLFWSATKGPAAACVLQAAERFGVSLEAPVSAVWPEFAAAGKESITIEELLSHRAGLPALAEPVSPFDYHAVVEMLAAQAPAWPRHAGHGYHPRTWGYLLDELVRRITGQTMQAYWQEHFALPLQLDLWMGVPTAIAGQVASIFPPRRAPAKGDPFFTAYLTAGSLTSRSFASPRGLHSASQMNSLEARKASLPAFGGIGTARALAKFYAMLAEGGALEGRRYLAESTVRRLQHTLVQGLDKVLVSETAFTLGFMRDPVDEHGGKKHAVFGPSLSAFGQSGAGGSTAFADPEHRLTFAYVMNQMEPGVQPNEKSLTLIESLYA